MNAKVFALVLFFVTNFKLCQGRNYCNYYLITMIPTEMYQMKYLRSLETQRYMDVQFWKQAYRMGTSAQLIVSQADIAMFRERADHFGLDYTIIMSDVQRAFNDQTVTRYKKLRPDTFSFQTFYILEDIYQWMTDLDTNKNYPVTQMTIGKSAEGRDLSLVNININPSIPKKKVNNDYDLRYEDWERLCVTLTDYTDTALRRVYNEHEVIIEGGIHGHEWTSVVYVTYLINKLARAEKSNNYEWKRLARSYDWYLIPVANPDGYVYTHKEDRLWRKNRSHNANRTYGVDLNRNFDQSFGKYLSSKNPSDETYCGPKPFSEPETKALSFFMTTNHKDLKYYFAIHAYGQRIIIPYEDKVQHVENFGEMENYGRQAVHKTYLRYKIKYDTGTMFDTTGTKMSGTSASWVKKHLKVKYAYTLLLRDNGTYGFALPCKQLLPMCEETSDMMTELMTAKPKFVKVLYGDDGTTQLPSLLLTMSGLCLTLILTLIYK